MSKQTRVRPERGIAKKRVGVGNSGNPCPQRNDPEVPKPFYNIFNNVHQINTKFHRCPHLKVKILSEEIEGLADTGASLTIISSVDLVNKLGLKIHPIAVKISTADGTAYRCLGFVNAPFTYQDKTHVIQTVIVPEVSKCLILGVDFLNKFGFRLLPPSPATVAGGQDETSSSNTMPFADDYFGDRSKEVCFQIVPSSDNNLSDPTENIDESLEMPTVELPQKTFETLDDLSTEHLLSDMERKALFEAIKQLPETHEGSLGRTQLIQHRIDLLPDAKPKRIAYYRWSPNVESVIDAEVERMEKLGVIEECHGPVDFLNPLLPIKKANGKWRICLDSRRLNQCTKKDDFPFPNMMGILQRIPKSKYFSVIDLSESYYQVPLEASAKDKTAFRTNKGLYRYTVMPFGLTNAPATMARLMTRVLGHDLEPYVYVYLDDIIIVSNSIDEHIRLIQIVAERLRRAGLTINLQKSKFCQKKIKYLGYVLSEEGLSMDVSKIQPVLDYPAPKTVKDIRRLLGLAGFYQKFLPNYSEITTPITNLLRKGMKKFQWTEEADAALQKLKTALVSAPILANADFSLPFIIETDSSDLAVGAVLAQVHDGVRKPIAYYSKKLSSTQRRYSATERECLAVLLSIENFKHFIEGSQFIIQTDAMSLTFLKTMSIESKSPRIARWALKLSKYDMLLQYKKGSDNVPADALSRAVNTIDVTSSSDPYITQLIKMVQTVPERYPDFRISDGKVYKYIIGSTVSEDPSFRWKYVVPVVERREIIRRIHSEAHLGFVKTLSKIRERHYWPRLASDVKRFCSQCEICRESKTPNINVQPICGKPKHCSRPWELISMDFLGPYPRSKRGNVWLLVVSDFFSKFVMVQCLRSATAASTCNFVENMIFNVFGAPSICITDNATVFKSELFQKMLQRFSVTHWPLSVYHPSPNPAERVNRVIVTAIRCSLNREKDHRDWDKDVHQIAKAIRTNVHESTGFSPYFLNFGRNMISSGSEYEALRESESPKSPQEVSKDMELLYSKVKENLLKAYQKYSHPYNLRANRKHQFEKGDVVYKKTMYLSDKSRNFVGKFANKFEKVRVKEVVGTNTYVLERLDGQRIAGSYHGSFLKRV